MLTNLCVLHLIINITNNNISPPTKSCFFLSGPTASYLNWYKLDVWFVLHWWQIYVMLTTKKRNGSNVTWVTLSYCPNLSRFEIYSKTIQVISTSSPTLWWQFMKILFIFPCLGYWATLKCLDGLRFPLSKLNLNPGSYFCMGLVYNCISTW